MSLSKQTKIREAALFEIPPRPGPEKDKIDAIFNALFSMEEGRERQCMVEALLSFTWRAWTWNVERFQEEMQRTRAERYPST